MTGKCIICESGHSTWVNEQHDAGLSTRQIAAELKEKFGLSASHVSVAAHLNHGDKSDRMAVLEQRIRNLELWLSKSLPDSIALKWFVNDARGSQEFSISNYKLYMATIPNPNALVKEEEAIKAKVMQRVKTEQAEMEEIKRLENVRRNEIIAAEKREREEMAVQAKEQEEKERIDGLRKQVSAYDNGDNE